MRSLPATGLQISKLNDEWRLGFSSHVVNDGPGYLRITGNGPGDGTMTAAQVVEMSDGSSETISNVGAMQFVDGGGHHHWHLLDFERYELRSANDPGAPIVRDQKTGFCLAAAYTTDLCGWGQPALTTVSEGLEPGDTDTYPAYLEGQYLVLDPSSMPNGDYLLVNRVNPTGALLDANAANDPASVRLTLTWNAGAPSMKILNSCTATIDCAAPAAPGPPPPSSYPPPGGTPASTITSDPAPTRSEPAPQPVPIVPPSQFTVAPNQVTMSPVMAARLVRRAIVRSTHAAPRRLRTICKRSTSKRFSCTASWSGTRASTWHARVTVWYVVAANARLSWRYSFAAVRQPGARRIVIRSASGSASIAMFRDAGILLCHAA